MIAAGKFDSTSLRYKCLPRTRMEITLLGKLLATDVAAAGRRLSALPEKQRDSVLDGVSCYLLKEPEQVAFACLVRDQLPLCDQVSRIMRQASPLGSSHGGGYANVSKYLDRIDASPDERSKCTEQAASQICGFGNCKNITRDDVDAMRAWVRTQAPDSLDRVTGTVLAQSSRIRTLEFIAAAELAVQYSQDSGNEEVLGRFLEYYVEGIQVGLQVKGKRAEQVRTYAGKLSDVQRRDGILAQLK